MYKYKIKYIYILDKNIIYFGHLTNFKLNSYALNYDNILLAYLNKVLYCLLPVLIEDKHCMCS